jgi:ZIP family zinc transporter
MLPPIAVWFRQLDPLAQAFLAGVVTWSVTAIGAGLVLFVGRLPGELFGAILGFAA